MVVLLTSGAVLGLMLLAAFVLARKAVAGSGLPLNADWIDELSVERYRPMMRLLDERDLEFLRAQPAMTPQRLTRVRRQRARIYAQYLRCLREDFGRVCTAVKLLMLQSGHDRPELASRLVRSQAAFAAGMASAYFGLALYRLGFGSANAGDLLRVFDGMRLELRSLVPAGLAAAA